MVKLDLWLCDKAVFYKLRIYFKHTTKPFVRQHYFCAHRRPVLKTGRRAALVLFPGFAGQERQQVGMVADHFPLAVFFPV